MKNDCISIEKDGDTVRDERVLVELFNENYINIMEISSGNTPSHLGNCEDNVQGDATADKIISKYSAHSSVQKIKRESSLDKEFELAHASAKDMNQIIRSLNINKANKFVKFVKILADIIDSHTTNINNISNNKDISTKHCLKSVQRQSFFWSVFSCIRTEYGD